MHLITILNRTLKNSFSSYKIQWFFSLCSKSLDDHKVIINDALDHVNLKERSLNCSDSFGIEKSE